MENEDKTHEPKDFLRRILVLEAGIFFLAAILALSLQVPFSIILFGLGLVVQWVGGRLVGTPRPRPVEFQPRHEKLPERVLHNLQTSLPAFALENAIFYAGLIAMALSMPFICQIMFQ